MSIYTTVAEWEEKAAALREIYRLTLLEAHLRDPFQCSE